ncbi:MAG: co-chaperone GroES [Patescibacteria group bacterium]|nr:co-chaperone GroES [Patescibacteria group bacterium]MDE2438660.1 co-chaperone GroES [Patescibacteria group bacterium]
MKIQPLSDHVFIESMKDEIKTKSGIVLPDSAEKEKPMKGKVIAVGAGKVSDKGERIAMSVKKGDTVLFTKYTPHEIKVDGKEYLVVRESDILAVLSE